MQRLDRPDINAVRAFVLRCVQRRARLPADADLAQLDYIETGYVDSMGMIKFLMELESEFDIEISEMELKSGAFRTVDGVIALIERKLEANARKVKEAVLF